ncbi:MAG: hypothetical protein EHM50_03230 [Lysobacterales bacterium]|nr:MAG: hypothetical protein EHM50_03230 [Xanthomonadales bacterium]
MLEPDPGRAGRRIPLRRVRRRALRQYRERPSAARLRCAQRASARIRHPRWRHHVARLHGRRVSRAPRAPRAHSPSHRLHTRRQRMAGLRRSLV